MSASVSCRSSWCVSGLGRLSSGDFSRRRGGADVHVCGVWECRSATSDDRERDRSGSRRDPFARTATRRRLVGPCRARTKGAGVALTKRGCIGSQISKTCRSSAVVSRDMAGAGSLTTSLNRPAARCRRVRAHQTSGTVRRATTTASGTDTTNGTLIDADAKRRKLPTDTAACAAGGSLYDTARWRADRTDRLVRVPSGDQGRARARQGQIGTLRRVRSWSIASVCGRICLLGELPVGKLRLLEGLKVRRAGLAGDARGGQGVVRGRVRLAGLELIAVGDALARVILTAPLLPQLIWVVPVPPPQGSPLSWSSDVTVPAASQGPAGPDGPEGPGDPAAAGGPLGPGTGVCAW